ELTLTSKPAKFVSAGWKVVPSKRATPPVEAIHKSPSGPWASEWPRAHRDRAGGELLTAVNRRPSKPTSPFFSLIQSCEFVAASRLPTDPVGSPSAIP